MTLYHCKGARSLRVLWTLEAMDLEHELVILPFPPRVEQRSFLDINPLGTVPYFVDGETHMSESAAICHYLAVRYGPTPLAVAPDHAEYGTFLNWLYSADATLTFPQTLVFRYAELEPPERRNPQVVEDYTRWFFGRLRGVEAALAGRQFLVAGRFTIADICVGYALHFAERLGLAGGFKPNTLAYWQRLQALPSYREVATR